MGILHWFQKSTALGLLILGSIVGIGGALGSALFHELISLTTFLAYGHSTQTGFLTVVESLSTWERVLIPTIGGLLVGLLFKVAKVDEAEGEGVPEVTEALAHKKGTIRPIVAPVKILTAAITLGSGGSAGREGPVIQIGSAIGSTVGQWFKQAAPERSLLLAAGAAAGIGGTFGAPAAGVLFTLEILKHRPNLLRAFVIIIAAFLSDIISSKIFGYTGLRFLATDSFSNYTDIAPLIGLSFIAAFIALLFGYILALTKKIGKRIPSPHVLRPTIGGLLIGLIGLVLPYIHEPAAYPFMTSLFSLENISITFLLLLLITKMIATGITLGSGGSGGIFAPLLFTGAITGSIYNILLHTTQVGEISNSTLVVTGMATVFAAAAHAPLTAAFITYEMTGNISLLVPLIICCIVATLLAKKLQKRSIYEHD